MDKVVVGVDLGGTILRAGAFDAQGKMLVVRETPIEAARGPKSGLRKMQRLIEQVWAESEAKSLAGIGIGATGPIDPIHGIINNPFTLPTWENVQVFEWMENAFGVPITLENDADVAALGEYWQGAGQATQRLYAITIGTGVGTALILDGEIYRGVDGSHPEGGHMVLDPNGPPCYCKMRGCWESLCAGPAIERQARESDLTGSRLWEMAAGERDKLEARMVFEAARIGDATAQSIVDAFTQYLIQGILNVCILFVPDVIVLSGGIMRSADLFMPHLEGALQAYTEMVPAHRVHITPAKLGYYAGLYGAAYTIWSKEL
jgi:glucokinase